MTTEKREGREGGLRSVRGGGKKEKKDGEERGEGECEKERGEGGAGEP
jgi:hypothetical protein